MMTEQEALGKWCPFTRQIVTVEHPVHGATAIAGMNRDKSDRPHGMCIASDCMAWRVTNSADDPHTVRGLGYCGLAGRL